MSNRILVIEDDPDGQEMIVTVLEHMKFVVDTADSGEQATKMIFDSGTSYNAIIIDLALPGKDGWEVLHDVLDNPKTENTICIAVTAFHNSKLREEALHAGFTAYFPKPLDNTIFLRELGNLL